LWLPDAPLSTLEDGLRTSADRQDARVTCVCDQDAEGQFGDEVREGLRARHEVEGRSSTLHLRSSESPVNVRPRTPRRRPSRAERSRR
jgi:hypothetical protein